MLLYSLLTKYPFMTQNRLDIPNFVVTFLHLHKFSGTDLQRNIQVRQQTQEHTPSLKMNVKPRRRGHCCHEVIDAMGLVRVKLYLSPNGIRLKRAGGELPQGPQSVGLYTYPTVWRISRPMDWKTSKSWKSCERENKTRRYGDDEGCVRESLIQIL